MITLLVSLSIFIFTFILIWYFLYLKPKKIIENFAKNAQKAGYKVKLMPFQFMGYYMLKYINQDDKSLKLFKEQFPKYDLIVGNHLTSLSIVPIDLQMIKDYFNKQSKLPKHPYVAQIFQTLSSGGTPFNQGNIWKKKRKVISSVFHFDFLNSMIPDIKQETNKQLKKIDQSISKNQPIDVQKIFVQILSSVIAKCFFGTSMQEYKVQGKPYSCYYVEYLDSLTDYLHTLEYVLLRTKAFKYKLTKKGRDLNKRYTILYGIAKQLAQNQIKKVKNNVQSKKNLVNSLCNSKIFQDVHKQNSQKYGIQDIIGQFFAFFAAGTDTTACTLNLIFYYLGQSENHKYVQKIRQEIKQIKSLNLTQSQQYKNMKWIQAVFNQVLRINGAASGLFNRLASQDIQLGQLKVPRGAQVCIYPIIENYKKQNFPNPEIFLPQRWMNNTNIIPYSFIPFGGGQRNCIGQYLSRLQAKIIISIIIENYDFKSLGPLKMKSGFVYRNINSCLQFKNRTSN